MYLWQHIDVQADWRSGTYGRSPQRHKHFVGFFNVPVLAQTWANLFIRLFPGTAPFTTRWWYRGHILNFNPWGGTNKPCELYREAVLGWFVCSALWFIPPWTQKKKTFILYIYNCFQWRPVLIQNSHRNGHLISFDVLIIAHVICPTTELLVDNGFLELNWKISAGFNKGNMIPL